MFGYKRCGWQGEKEDDSFYTKFSGWVQDPSQVGFKDLDSGVDLFREEMPRPTKTRNMGIGTASPV